MSQLTQNRIVSIAIVIATVITLLDGQIFNDLLVTSLYKISEFVFFLIMGIWLGNTIVNAKNKKDI